MNKQAVLQEIYQTAFEGELDKIAEESDDELISRMARLGRGLKRGAGKGKGMPGGLRRNKNEEECEAGGPGKGEGGGQGGGVNRKG